MSSTTIQMHLVKRMRASPTQVPTVLRATVQPAARMMSLFAVRVGARRLRFARVLLERAMVFIQIRDLRHRRVCQAACGKRCVNAY